MKVIDYLEVKERAGEIGIEIEMEGSNIEEAYDLTYWRSEYDGSLRGESIEYVLETPVLREEVLPSLKELADHFEDNGTRFKETERAGIHVHINVQDESMVTLGNFICLYYTFETLLMNHCGHDRVGNHFCLRLRDAEDVVPHLQHALNICNLRALYTDEIRYASLNLKALPEYGSLEFRGMRSTNDFSEIELWVNLLLKLKDYARTLNSPQEISHKLSALGAFRFLSEVFGDDAKLFQQQEVDVSAVMYEDMRRVQGIMHAKQWHDFGNLL